MMNASRLALRCCSLLLLACGCGAPPPNGKQQVLNFHPEYPAVVQGMTFHVFIPEDVKEGEGFERTRLVVETPGDTFIEDSGLGPAPAWAPEGSPDGWSLRLRCGSSGELGVKVQLASQVRYEDATDIRCVTPQLEIGLPAREAYFIGERFRGALMLSAQGEDGKPVTPGGHGVRFVGAEPIVDATEVLDEVKDGWTFEAVRGGADFELQLGDQRVRFPISVAGADWALALATQPAMLSSTVNDAVELTATGATVDGRALELTECAFALQPAGDQVAGTHSCHTFVRGPWSGEACVTSRGKTTCVQYTWPP